MRSWIRWRRRDVPILLCSSGSGSLRWSTGSSGSSSAAVVRRFPTGGLLLLPPLLLQTTAVTVWRENPKGVIGARGRRWRRPSPYRRVRLGVGRTCAQGGDRDVVVLPLSMADHKADAEFLNKRLENYAEMETIFRNSIATGKFAKGSSAALGTDDGDTEEGNGNGVSEGPSRLHEKGQHRMEARQKRLR
ncbi:hypothetical protein BAE44_0003617 [Dichanthelium oligosanthes]|uniref:Uncharacterized protein n=1 Tax=Dichanthelium oligosanthes TaxID=888268 RepID=A0A1E5WDA4_9POAL|nr:hypothetical protein BAE44_0003617 [Dichanthelium oligosanthes]